MLKIFSNFFLKVKNTLICFYKSPNNIFFIQSDILKKLKITLFYFFILILLLFIYLNAIYFLFILENWKYISLFYFIASFFLFVVMFFLSYMALLTIVVLSLFFYYLIISKLDYIYSIAKVNDFLINLAKSCSQVFFDYLCLTLDNRDSDWFLWSLPDLFY